jgi:preprotein translocase subunit SecD
VLKSLKFRFAIVVIVLVIAGVFLVPNFFDLTGASKRYLPSDKIRLGLDLKGGMHLLLAMDTSKMMENMVDRKLNGLKDGMIRDSVRFLGLEKRGDLISVSIKAEQKEKLYNLLGKEFPDLKVAATRTEGEVLSLDLSILEKEVVQLKENAVRQALETIRNRIDQFGVSEPLIVQQGEDQILVQLPGIKDPERALELIGRTAQLEFKLVDEDNAARASTGSVPEGSEILPMKSRNKETKVVSSVPMLIKKQVLLTGDLLTDARVKFGGEIGGEPYVALEFNSEGGRIFDQVTGANVNKRLAIILDNSVYSAPVIRERISGGKASITGSFTMDEAKDLAIVLRAGALPAPVKVIQNITIGPTLGQDSIRKGVQAAILGAILVVVFMVVYYRASGIVADIALFMNMFLLLGAFTALSATMTLPGIAGIILTMGMGVDSNVLIFERIREELRLGKTVRAAIDGGYSKAWVTIFDSHITTLITTFILFLFGTGPIKGFAVTLSIGVIINLFTAVLGSKVIFDWIVQKYKPRSLSI